MQAYQQKLKQLEMVIVFAFFRYILNIGGIRMEIERHLRKHMIMKGTQVYIKGSLHYFLPTNSEIKSKRHNLNYDAHVNTTLTVQLTGLKKRRKQTKETRRQNGEAL